MRSPARPSTNCAATFLSASNRLGLRSAAIIEPDRSIAIAISTPSPERVFVLTSTSRGRVMAIIIHDMAARRSTHNTTRERDTMSGASTKPRMLDILRYGYSLLPIHHKYPARSGTSSRSQKKPLLTISKLFSVIVFAFLFCLFASGFFVRFFFFLFGAQGVYYVLGVQAVSLVIGI